MVTNAAHHATRGRTPRPTDVPLAELIEKLDTSRDMHLNVTPLYRLGEAVDVAQALDVALDDALDDVAEATLALEQIKGRIRLAARFITTAAAGNELHAALADDLLALLDPEATIAPDAGTVGTLRPARTGIDDAAIDAFLSDPELARVHPITQGMRTVQLYTAHEVARRHTPGHLSARQIASVTDLQRVGSACLMCNRLVIDRPAELPPITVVPLTDGMPPALIPLELRGGHAVICADGTGCDTLGPEGSNL